MRVITACVFSVAMVMSFSILGMTSVEAQGIDGFGVFRVPAECNTRECSWVDLIRLGNEVINFAVYIAIIGATIAIAYAGFNMLINAGNASEIKKSQKMITTAIIGIVVTLGGWLFVKFILDQFGVDARYRTLIQ
jgi:hypothetical protein